MDKYEINLEIAFRSLLGQLVWSVKRGFGTFLTLEFGCPHLLVREPLKVSSDSSEKVRRNFSRRRVHVIGEYHFWIQDANWEVKTKNYCITNESVNSPSSKTCLDEIGGQLLVSVNHGSVSNSCVLNFDLGGTISISPKNEIASDNDQWSIHEYSGQVVSYTGNGNFVREPASVI